MSCLYVSQTNFAQASRGAGRDDWFTATLKHGCRNFVFYVIFFCNFFCCFVVI